MSFGEPCRNRGSESLMVDDFDLFRGALVSTRSFQGFGTMLHKPHVEQAEEQAQP